MLCTHTHYIYKRVDAEEFFDKEGIHKKKISDIWSDLGKSVELSTFHLMHTQVHND